MAVSPAAGKSAGNEEGGLAVCEECGDPVSPRGMLNRSPPTQRQRTHPAAGFMELVAVSHVTIQTGNTQLQESGQPT